MGRPTVFPTGTTVYNPEKCWSGYTIFAAPGKGTALIDMNGKAVRWWKDFQAFPAKMVPGGKIFGHLGQRDHSAAYQDDTDLTEIDFDGNVLWSFDHNQFVNDEDSGPRWVARQHHDFQIEGNPVGYYVPGQDPKDDFNKVLLLTHNDVSKPKVSPQLLVEDALLEIDREGNILWTWNLMDHFREFNLSETQKNTIYRDPNIQECGPDGEGDIFHINCASYLGPNKWFDEGDERFNPENIIMDSREANIMFIISHKTGKVVWSIGPDYTVSRELRIMGPIIGMHHSHMIPKGLPGAGNIMVFDNGGWAGYGAPSQVSRMGIKSERRDSSRVMEINPQTLKIEWSFSADDLGWKTPFTSHYFYSPLTSNAQRLPNGNTMITEGTTGRLIEVTADKELVWEYNYPSIGPGLFYRAYRIPYEWVPQLTKPEEVPVAQLDNATFQVPGASDPTLTEDAMVTVAGTKGFGKPGNFCVDKL